jgi:hypothetical protein
MKADRRIAILTTLLVACLISGCASLETPFVVGEPVSFNEDSMQEDLVFRLAGAPYILRLVDAETFRVATVEWDKEEEVFQLVSGELVVSQLGKDTRLLNFRIDGVEHYTVLKLSHEEGDLESADFQAVAHTVDEAFMDRLAKTGRVTRIQERDDREGPTFMLEGDKSAVDRFFRIHSSRLFESRSGLEIVQAGEEEASAIASRHRKEFLSYDLGMQVARIDNRSIGKL